MANLEEAAAIGRLRIEADGWKRIFRVNLSAPPQALDRVVQVAREQLVRLVSESGPAEVALADEIAHQIEGASGGVGVGSPGGDGEPPNRRPARAFEAVTDGGSRWG